MVNTIIWTLGIYLFFFILFFLLILLFFFLGFTNEGPKEKEEKTRAGAQADRYFLLLYDFFLAGIPIITISPHYGMKRAPTTDYTIVWAQGMFFYENLYYLLIFSFFLGFNTYKRQRCHLGLKERAGNPRFKRILSPAPLFFFIWTILT